MVLPHWPALSLALVLSVVLNWHTGTITGTGSVAGKCTGTLAPCITGTQVVGGTGTLASAISGTDTVLSLVLAQSLILRELNLTLMLAQALTLNLT